MAAIYISIVMSLSLRESYSCSGGRKKKELGWNKNAIEPEHHGHLLFSVSDISLLSFPYQFYIFVLLAFNLSRFFLFIIISFERTCLFPIHLGGGGNEGGAST